MASPHELVVASASVGPPRSLTGAEVAHLAATCSHQELVELLVDVHQQAVEAHAALASTLEGPRRLSLVTAVNQHEDACSADCVVDGAIWLLPVRRHVAVSVGHLVELAPTASGFVVAASRGPHRGGIRAQVVTSQEGLAIEPLGAEAQGRGLLPAIIAPAAGDPSRWADGTLVRAITIPGEMALVLQVLHLVDRVAQMAAPVWFRSRRPGLGRATTLDEE